MDGLLEGLGETGMPGVDFVVAVGQRAAPTQAEFALEIGYAEAGVGAGNDFDPALHPGVDIALEGVDAGVVEFALVGLALGGLAEVEDIGAGWLAGAVVNFGANVVEGGIAIGDFEVIACLDRGDMGDVAAADLFELDFGRNSRRYFKKLGIDDPDDDIAEFALGADFPVFGVADGAFAAAAGGGDEGFVVAVGLADEGDGAGDVSAGEDGGKEEEADQMRNEGIDWRETEFRGEQGAFPSSCGGQQTWERGGRRPLQGTLTMTMASFTLNK